MYTLDNAFKIYFDELEPERRLEILNSFSENKESEFIRSVYNNRYSDHDKRGRKEIDWWLWRCVCLQILYGRGKIFKKSRDKEVIKITNELLMNDEDFSHKNFLYYEYRNVAKRYLSTCRHSSYASSFLGLKRAEDDEKAYRACKDIWEMSKGIAKSANLEQQMSLWNEAFYDELMNFDPKICREEYQRLDS